MKNYREQSGCHNCDFMFMYSEYDEENRYICTYKAPARPLSGSVAMRESVFRKNLSYEEENKAWEQRQKEWHEWSDKREVKSYGICEAIKQKNAS